MEAQSLVRLAPFTTFHIGGPARAYLPARSDEETDAAVAFARERELALFVLGAGSNILVPDAGVDGAVLHMLMRDVRFEDRGDHAEILAGAGLIWDDVVDAASARGLYGIENLAGIPGTVGGAAVQNIGAYGAELAPAFLYAEVIDSATGKKSRITDAEAKFAYRSSIFKQQPRLVITRVALALKKQAELLTDYADLARAAASGVPLATPADVARAVRAIRAPKFPSHENEGTAGSFFKNPHISKAHAASLVQRFPGLPTFAQENGMVKIPLAWILDHVLALKGFAIGPVRLYENQPLVIVAQAGATASDVEALASHVTERVRNETEILIEREVETMCMPPVSKAMASSEVVL